MQTRNQIRRRRNASREEGAELYQERRREVIAAASRVFAKKGFQATSFAAVAEELNIDRASLYYYVSSKEELFDDVVRDACLDNVARAQAILKSNDTPVDKIRHFVIECLMSYERHYPFLHIYVRENLKSVADDRSAWANQMRQLNHDYEDAIIGVIEEGYADGSFRKAGPSRIVAFGIMGMLNWASRWFKPTPGEPSAEEIGNIFADMVVASLVNGDKPDGALAVEY